MSFKKVKTLIVGGGQAGIAMSENLTNCGEPHLVLERHRIAERWRTERWDSLVANGPAWHDRFPGMAFSDLDPDAFATKDAVADYFEKYADYIKSPLKCGVEVTEVKPIEGSSGFYVKTSDGDYEATNIVAATGPFQKPVIPPLVPDDAPLSQMHSNTYHNPQQLPDGAVLIVGAGSSGAQIAQELMLAGKDVYLSVGPHDRPPRRYRERDFVWWLGVLGKWDAQALEPGTEHVTISVSGAHGGETVDFRHLANQGITLLGMTERYDNGILHFCKDLKDNIENGDKNYLSVLDEADEYVNKNNINLPLEPQARQIDPDPDCVKNPILELDLKKRNINTIIWATGYALDYSWLKVDAFDECGRPSHKRGISKEPGIYFLGLPWLSGRGSSFIWGVWHDAKFLADHIANRHKYLKYHEDANMRSVEA